MFLTLDAQEHSLRLIRFNCSRVAPRRLKRGPLLNQNAVGTDGIRGRCGFLID